MIRVVSVSRDQRIAVKRVKRSKYNMSPREYEVLNAVKGNKHCVQMLDFYLTKNDYGRLTANYELECVPDCLEAYIGRTRSSHETIPIQNIKKIMKQLFMGLEFMHSKGICHRDLKPDNVLLTDEFDVRICDFGSAKKLDDINIPLVGSRYYRAPELILLKNRYTVAVDIWSAGCIFAEMFLLGELFPGTESGLQLFEISATIGSMDKTEFSLMTSSLR